MVRASSQEERIAALERQVATLTRELKALRPLQNGDVAIRAISRGQARREVLALFEAGGTVYYSDIVQRLGIDIDDVIAVCEALELEGKIETLGDAAKIRVTELRGNEFTSRLAASRRSRP